MDEFEQHCAAAYHGERVTSRRLALRTGVSEAAALRATLERVAGAAGLSALLAERGAQQAAQAARSAARAAAREHANTLRAARHDGEATPWRAWFDGSAHPNPGNCGIGALLLGPDGERVEVARAVGYGNSSEAEYQALIAVLEAARAAGARRLTVYGDSRVVIDDMASDQASPALAEWRAAARALLAELDHVVLRWIPRHKNSAADALSQRAVEHRGQTTFSC